MSRTPTEQEELYGTRLYWHLEQTGFKSGIRSAGPSLDLSEAWTIHQNVDCGHLPPTEEGKRHFLMLPLQNKRYETTKAGLLLWRTYRTLPLTQKQQHPIKGLASTWETVAAHLYPSLIFTVLNSGRRLKAHLISRDGRCGRKSFPTKKHMKTQSSMLLSKSKGNGRLAMVSSLARYWTRGAEEPLTTLQQQRLKYSTSISLIKITGRRDVWPPAAHTAGWRWTPARTPASSRRTHRAARENDTRRPQVQFVGRF